MAVRDIVAPGTPAGSGGRVLPVRTRRYPVGERTYIMGILNVTPDSFYDGEAYFEAPAAVERALAMVEEGADLIDVGGESTRPGAEEVSAEEELRRVLPVIRAVAARTDVPISIDTRKARVAEAAVEAGAQLVNDVSGLAHDPEMARTVARLGVGVVVMHSRGSPATMQSLTNYGDVVADSARELVARVRAALEAGVEPDRILVDPGFGFAKTAEQNFRLLARLREWHRLTRLDPLPPFPLLVGTSRKSFIGKALGGAPPLERLEGTAATVALAIAGGADVVRVHDVAAMRRVAAVADAAVRQGAESDTGAGVPGGPWVERGRGGEEASVELVGMGFSARHGVYEDERAGRQPFVVDVRLWLRGVPPADRLDQTVDYAEVYRLVQQVVEGPSVSLVETLAASVASALEARFGPRLRRIRVRVHKPGAPLPGPVQDVVATVERSWA